MSKLILLTDTHFGVRGGKEEFHRNMELFYANVFFPYLKNNHFDSIIHLGDVYHERRRIDTLTIKRAREYFFAAIHRILSEQQKHIHIIAGNHDAFFKDDLDTNSINEIIANQNFADDEWNPFILYTKVKEIPGYDAVFVPWITKTNREKTQEVLAKSKAKYVFGHLELSGFNFSKVQVATHGDDPKDFSKFEKVFSGHYHYRHQKDNIYYLGSPTEQTWIDLDTKRGFHTFDTETGELEFIENPYNIFERIKFGELSFDTKPHPKYYRVLRTGDEKQSDVDIHTKILYQNNAIDVEYIQTVGAPKLTITASETTLDSIEDTPVFIKNYVEDEAVAGLMIELYNRAINEDHTA